MSARTFEDLPRAQRKHLLGQEAKWRSSGEWGVWELLTFPRGSAGCAWAAEFTTAHKNRVFSVLDRTVANNVRHLAVTSLSGIRPTWWEMQRIKNELAGHATTAVEVYPPQAQVVDEADMYHIWVLTDPLPFGLGGGGS